MRTIYRTAGCVVVLYDEMTGRQVNRDNFSVTSTSGNQAIYKENGMYVFVGEQEKTEITIMSRGYQTKKIQTDGKSFYYRAWLMPSLLNDRLVQMTVLKGTAPSFAEVRLIPEKTELPYRLMRDSKAGEREISIYHLSYEEIEGREFSIGKVQVENIRIQQRLGNGRYLLEEPVRYAHGISDTQIFRVCRVTADAAGEFVAAFPDIPPQGCECIIETGKEQRKVMLKYREMVIERSDAGEK